ncbi:MAG TPA: acetyl-CoA carboxylase, carboxyltransferase subunit beta [Blastocatellia bacterium]|nr:acetyl-CoA carboxylase, carboxyltransferase subunit beta [Blastocatellia bacterium]
MPWFRRDKESSPSKGDELKERTVKTEGLFAKCPQCTQTLFRKELEENLQVCPKCQFHFKLDPYRRLELLFDNGQYNEFDKQLASTDPLSFVDNKRYSDRLKSAPISTGTLDAVINAEGRIGGHQVFAAAMVFDFIGGSMGSVVGEKITRLIERAIDQKSAVITISCSSGARMMEGALSLMQMAKISAALARLDDDALPFISVLTHPTTGGVSASFAMLGDLNIAEPGAQIGFAGPRVIEQTIRQKLPEGFQSAESLLEHGMLDAIVCRRELRDYIINALNFMVGHKKNSAA